MDLAGLLVWTLSLKTLPCVRVVPMAQESRASLSVRCLRGQPKSARKRKRGEQVRRLTSNSRPGAVRAGADRAWEICARVAVVMRLCLSLLGVRGRVERSKRRRPANLCRDRKPESVGTSGTQRTAPYKRRASYQTLSMVSCAQQALARAVWTDCAGTLTGPRGEPRVGHGLPMEPIFPRPVLGRNRK